MASLLQQLPGDDSVILRVTHSNIKSFAAEIRFSLEMTLDSVKEKLWKKCGTSVDSMRLELFDDAGVKICDLSDNLRPLGFYSPQDGYRLHIIDLDLSSLASGGWLEDTSLVEKYKISEEAYDKLDSNFRKFKEKLISQSPASHENSLSENYMEDLCMNIKVGDRCEVEPGEKRGVVKFLGRAETVAAGIWVGIQLDEPLGKNDGMVKGKRYFDCPPQHGLLVRPDKVKIYSFILWNICMFPSVWSDKLPLLKNVSDCLYGNQLPWEVSSGQTKIPLSFACFFRVLHVVKNIPYCLCLYLG